MGRVIPGFPCRGEPRHSRASGAAGITGYRWASPGSFQSRGCRKVVRNLGKGAFPGKGEGRVGFRPGRAFPSGRAFRPGRVCPPRRAAENGESRRGLVEQRRPGRAVEAWRGLYLPRGLRVTVRKWTSAPSDWRAILPGRTWQFHASFTTTPLMARVIWSPSTVIS